MAREAHGMHNGWHRLDEARKRMAVHLYVRFRRPLLAVCNRRLHDHAEAEDAFQDTFERVLLHIGGFDADRPPLPWLQSIADHRSISIHRRRARVDVVPDLDLDHPQEELDPLRQIIRAEELQEALSAIHQLPPRQRAALLMHLDGVAYSEIGRRIGASSTGVKALIHRARTRLRALCDRGAYGLSLLAFRARRRRLHPGVEAATTTFGQQLAFGSLALAISIAGVEMPVAASRHRPEARAVQAVAAVPDGSLHQAVDPRVVSETDDGGVRAPADRLVRDLVDPNGEIRHPRQTQVVDLEPSPRYEHDQTLFAVGVAPCAGRCPPVLFKSTDGGASWQRLGARGLLGTNLVLPPRFGDGDNRLFVVGPDGVQVTEDEAATFRTTATSGRLRATQASISPMFNEGDPRIFIGGDLLLQYDDRTRLITPAVFAAPQASATVAAFGATYRSDGAILVGGKATPTTKDGFLATCREHICPSHNSTDEQPRRVVTFVDAAGSSVAAVAGRTSIGIVDNSSGLRRLFRTAPETWVADIAVVDHRTIFAVLSDPRGGGGHLVRVRGAKTPSKRLSTPRDLGAVRLVRSSSEAVWIAGNGVACSSDGGRRWSVACTP